MSFKFLFVRIAKTYFRNTFPFLLRSTKMFFSFSFRLHDAHRFYSLQKYSLRKAVALFGLRCFLPKTFFLFKCGYVFSDQSGFYVSICMLACHPHAGIKSVYVFMTHSIKLSISIYFYKCHRIIAQNCDEIWDSTLKSNGSRMMLHIEWWSVTAAV